MAMLRRFLAVSVLAGLTSTVIANEYNLACEVVGAVISDASNLYYPGK